MKEKCILIWSLLICLSLNAQVWVKSSDQQLIEGAIDGCFFDISQSYRIIDPKTNQIFGRNGNNAFGTVASFGVKTIIGFCIPDMVVHPWNYDSNFAKYKGLYTPVTYKYQIKDSTDIVIDSLIVDKDDTLLHFVNDSTLVGKGLTFNSTKGDLHGWLVWRVEPQENAPKYIIYKKDLNFTDNARQYDIEKPGCSFQLSGAIYIIPRQQGIGVLQFDLAGVVYPQNGKWVLFPTSTIEKTWKGRQNEESDERPLNEDELTPINDDSEKGKKIKKNRK